jgi:ketosteroid isomerase-like protein
MSHGRLSAAVLACTAFACALPAQEWSAAQKEVWSNVEAYNQAYVKEDLEGFMAYVDDDYLGWSRGRALPGSKADVRKNLSYFFANYDVVLFDVKPVGIKIHGDVAFVHYYYMEVNRGKDGVDKREKGRWTDILQKKGQRWVMIGDHGGEDPSD